MSLALQKFVLLTVRVHNVTNPYVYLPRVFYHRYCVLHLHVYMTCVRCVNLMVCKVLLYCIAQDMPKERRERHYRNRADSPATRHSSPSSSSGDEGSETESRVRGSKEKREGRGRGRGRDRRRRSRSRSRDRSVQLW